MSTIPMTLHAKWFTHPRSSLIAKFGAYSMCTQALSRGNEDHLRYRSEWSEVCIPVRANIFVLSKTFRQSLAPIQLPCQWASGRQGLEAGHLPLSRDEAKNKWSYISTPPIRLHDADKENFTFLRNLSSVFHSKVITIFPRQFTVRNIAHGMNKDVEGS
jgi:hypothetical protein